MTITGGSGSAVTGLVAPVTVSTFDQTCGTNYVSTFMHQMIPHHANAVNMAKVLLKTSTTYGDNTLGVNIAGAAGEYDGVEDLLLDMVHTQNYQISEMRK